MRLYGPYTRKDGRQIIIEIDNFGIKHTISYPKWIMEQHLGRKLHPKQETIDHIDGNFNNNSLDNLRIIPLSQHIKEDVIRVAHVKITCIWCKKVVIKDGGYVRYSEKKGTAGPFCGKSCIGKYGAEKQNGRTTKMHRVPLEAKKYFTLKSGLVSQLAEETDLKSVEYLNTRIGSTPI